ncbi:MAG: T9SS C-terminal target domain-containing protein [Ignavibacteriae bacterium]|nr:MAG: T9SS C-terminal target domain-containing protein [Ignavibacteriota bacterium]
MRQIFIAILLLLSVSAYAQQSVLFIEKHKANNEHWLFNSYSDSTNGTWNYVSPVPQPLCGVVSCYIPSINKILICGGLNSSLAPQRTCFFYDPVNNSYSAADSLPVGRAFGKLVTVRDSIYLVGSINSNFNIPDGALFMYLLDSNKWVQKASTPAPFIQEMAVCVWSDSLIVTIGGSTGGFSGATNTVRIFDPFYNSWRTLTTTFSTPVVTAQAEILDSNLVVVGGFGYLGLNKVYHTIFNPALDTALELDWKDLGVTPFGTSVYRVAGGKWANYMLFGPAIHDTLAVPQIWGLNIVDTTFTWRRFLPDMQDSISNITSISVISTADSVHFYLFGGIFNNLAFTDISSKYTFFNPYIGITGKGENVPQGYKLYQNYPNPFNPSTVINYSLPKAGVIKLVVTDVLGREISILVNEYKQAGTHSVMFRKNSLASGIYFYTLISGDFKESKKMLLLK